MASGGISIHAVDVANGRIAAGMRVEILRIEGAPALIAEGQIGANGVFDHPTMRGEGVTGGLHEARFFIGDYFEKLGQPQGILEVAPFRFIIRDVAQHYHLPLKFTAHGFSLYRGA